MPLLNTATGLISILLQEESLLNSCALCRCGSCQIHPLKLHIWEKLSFFTSITDNQAKKYIFDDYKRQKCNLSATSDDVKGISILDPQEGENICDEADA